MPDQNTTNILKWSALSMLKQSMIDSIPETIGKEIGRGVIGKAEGVNTDYRVLVKSPSYTGSIHDVAYIGNPSSEKIDTLSWENKNGVIRATHFYPSKARDASNRANTLGRNILETSRTELDKLSCPILLYQLAILKRVQQYQDESWWDERNDAQWKKNYYSLDVSNDKPITKDEIITALESLGNALLNITRYISQEELSIFYKRVLSSSNFIAPTLKEKNIPIEMFLALFLPLQESIYSKLSFVIQIPSSWSINSSKIKNNWNIVPNLNIHDMNLVYSDNDFYHKIAKKYAEAIFTNNPLMIEELSLQNTTEELATVEESELALAPLEENIYGEETDATIKNSIAFESSDKEQEKKYSSKLDSYSICCFNEILKNNKPDDDSNEQVKKLYSYLCSQGMYIKNTEYSQIDTELSIKDKELLKKWHQLITIEYKESNYSKDREVFFLKVEYMKAVYLYLVKEEGVLSEILPDEESKLITQRVPLLLFAAKDTSATKWLDKIFDSSKDNLLKKLFLQSLNLNMSGKYQKEMAEFSKTIIYSNTGRANFLKDDTEITVAIENIN